MAARSDRATRSLVTGASSGIGAAFARRLASDGSDLVLVARRRQALEALAAECRERHAVQVEILAADLLQDEGLARVEERLASGPPIDLLIQSAGVGALGEFGRLEVDRAEAQVRLNVLACVRLAHAALGPMRQRRRGAIVHVSSLASLGPYPYLAVYAASKAFLTSFSEALSEELRGSGIRVQALLPGLTRSEFFLRAGADESRIPELAWMQADRVVDESLAALGRGETLCVPGRGNRALAALAGLLPRAGFRRLAGLLVSTQRGGH